MAYRYKTAIKKLLSLLACLSVLSAFVSCTPSSSDTDETLTGEKILIKAGNSTFTATLADNETADRFYEMLPLTLDMSELNGNEKYFYLDEALPSQPYQPETIEAGDLMLYGTSCVVLFYETFSSSYSYTAIGKIDDAAGLEKALGEGGVTVSFTRVSDAESGGDSHSSQTDEDKNPDEGNKDETVGQGVPDNSEDQSGTDNSGQDGTDEPGNTGGVSEVTVMYIYINGNRLTVNPAENSAVTALTDILKKEDIICTVRDYGGFEKVGSLGHTLPTSNEQITTEPGDVILYQGNQIVLFYGSNSWSYTKLGKIEGYTASELYELLGGGKGDMQLRLSLA